MRHTHALPLLLLLSCSAAIAAPRSHPTPIGGGATSHPLARPTPPKTPTADYLYSLVLARNYPAVVGAAAGKLRASPNDAEALALQALAFIKLGQKEQARGPLARALGLALPDSRARAFALVAKATLADADGKPDDALQAYIAAGSTDGNVALPYIAFADYFVKTTQNDKAKRLLQAARGKSMTKDEAAAINLAYSRL